MLKVLALVALLTLQSSVFAASHYARSLYNRIQNTTNIAELEALETEAFLMQVKIENQWPNTGYSEEYTYTVWVFQQLEKATQAKREYLTTQGERSNAIAFLYQNIMWHTNPFINRADNGLTQAKINTPSGMSPDAQNAAKKPIPADILAGRTGNYPQEPTREPSFVRMQRLEKQLALETAQAEANRKRAAQAAKTKTAVKPKAKAKTKPKTRRRK